MSCSSLAQWASCIHVSPKATFFHCLSIFISQKVCLLKVMLNFFSRIPLKRFSLTLLSTTLNHHCHFAEEKVFQSFSHVWLFVTLRTVALQAPLSMGFPRQEYWSRFAISSSRGSSWLRDQTHVFCVGRRILYHYCHMWSPQNLTEGHWNLNSISFLKFLD